VVTKHFRFFMREGLREILAENISEILKNKISHSIAGQKVF